MSDDRVSLRAPMGVQYRGPSRTFLLALALLAPFATIAATVWLVITLTPKANGLADLEKLERRVAEIESQQAKAIEAHGKNFDALKNEIAALKARK